MALWPLGNDWDTAVGLLGMTVMAFFRYGWWFLMCVAVVDMVAGCFVYDHGALPEAVFFFQCVMNPCSEYGATYTHVNYESLQWVQSDT